MNLPLDLDPGDLAVCVSCGLCLPYCPTYRVTLDERYSPRGRINLMRAAEEGTLAMDNEWFDSLDTCIQCLGCETACPSGVKYGSLIAGTKTAMAQQRTPGRKLRAGLWVLKHPRLLLWGSRAMAVGQRLGLLPRNSSLWPKKIPLRRPKSTATATGEVVLFTGCVMDTWMPEVHRAAEKVLQASGTAVMLSGTATGCCGALHEHAGLTDQAQQRAQRVMDSLPGEHPILVDAAGCGAALKNYGHLLGTEEAQEFSERVFDIQEWLAKHPERLAKIPLKETQRPPVIVQDPCHLRHAQQCHEAVRDVLAPVAELVELDDEGLCCGAGGSFSLVHPELAQGVRERKMEAIARAGNHEVVSANPGCALHLGAAGAKVRHPLELLAEAIVDPQEPGT